MELITPEEIDGLPDDPRTAFVEFEWIVRMRIDALMEREQEEDRFDGTVARERYVMAMIAAARAYGIDEMPDVNLESFDSDMFYPVRRAAIRIATEMTLGAKRRRSSESVALGQGSRERLKKHVADLDAALNVADLPDKKKKALRAKLDQFAQELTKDRASMAVMFAVAASFAAAMHGISETEDAIIKLPKTIESIQLIIGKEKAEEEENTPPPALPSPKVQKSLPPPEPKPVPQRANFGGGGFADDLDDDVPF